MGRPPKDKNKLMNVPLRLMVTADQKKLIDDAVQLESGEFAEWARTILLRAAQKRVAQGKARTQDAD
jgi:hypothetical protein